MSLTRNLRAGSNLPLLQEILGVYAGSSPDVGTWSVGRKHHSRLAAHGASDTQETRAEVERSRELGRALGKVGMLPFAYPCFSSCLLALIARA